MEEPRIHYFKCNKSITERKILNDRTYMWIENNKKLEYVKTQKIGGYQVERWSGGMRIRR